MNQPVVLIVGATSSLARALAYRFAELGAKLYLAGRDVEETERIARDLSVRFATDVLCGMYLAEDYGSHKQLIDNVKTNFGFLDVVVVAVGELGDQRQAEKDFDHAQQVIQSNYTGAVSLLTHVANMFEQQQNGLIVGISSVAGDRGRQSNYVYGSAKGALSLFLQGLRSRLAKCGVHVLTVKPGFMDTKMTFGKSGMFWVASPHMAATAIMKACHKRKDIAYVPWFWFWIMLIIRLIPEPIYKRLKL
ncbi:MAG: SDR family oxidoreductase [Candidatus Melainabacteria bacterium]|nr:SDR family oxidoreductase [Candidatus Melainabacteria bacterium]